MYIFSNKLFENLGKFYLVDTGFMIKSGLLTSYRGEQYRVKEYSRNPPQNHRDYAIFVMLLYVTQLNELLVF